MMTFLLVVQILFLLFVIWLIYNGIVTLFYGRWVHRLDAEAPQEEWDYTMGQVNKWKNRFFLF